MISAAGTRRKIGHLYGEGEEKSIEKKGINTRVRRGDVSKQGQNGAGTDGAQKLVKRNR